MFQASEEKPADTADTSNSVLVSAFDTSRRLGDVVCALLVLEDGGLAGEGGRGERGERREGGPGFATDGRWKMGDGTDGPRSFARMSFGGQAGLLNEGPEDTGFWWKFVFIEFCMFCIAPCMVRQSVTQ
jgi:hypothetical protein